MKSHIRYVQNRVKQNFAHIVFFATLFAFLGWLLPNIYFRYFDTTEYYKVYSPVEVDKEKYKACEIVNAYLHRLSLINTNAESVIELTLIKENGDLDEVYRELRTVGIDKGEKIIITHYTLPCTITEGLYYIAGSVDYHVNGVLKNTSFQTETFTVYK